MISVIVPVYEVEPYLDTCIESILNQSFRDLELILVDDGSPDRCGEMCDSWALKDARIRVIHQANAGLSEARNTGINNAKGEWLCFVDSDDWVAKDMLELLHAVIVESGADMAVSNYVKVSDGSLGDVVHVAPGLLTSEEYWLRLYAGNRTYYTVAWAKLYKREVFAKCRYTPGKINEDDQILYDILSACKRIAISDKVVYYYRQRSNSIMGSTRSLKNLSVPEAHLKNAERMYETKRWFLAESALTFAVRELVFREYGEGGKLSEEFASLDKEAERLYRKMFWHLSLKRKLVLLLYFIDETVYQFFIKEKKRAV